MPEKWKVGLDLEKVTKSLNKCYDLYKKLPKSLKVGAFDQKSCLIDLDLKKVPTKKAR